MNNLNRNVGLQFLVERCKQDKQNSDSFLLSPLFLSFLQNSFSPPKCVFCLSAVPDVLNQIFIRCSSEFFVVLGFEYCEKKQVYWEATLLSSCCCFVAQHRKYFLLCTLGPYVHRECWQRSPKVRKPEFFGGFLPLPLTTLHHLGQVTDPFCTSYCSSSE